MIRGQVFLYCWKCQATAIAKHQKLFPTEKLIQEDIEVDQAEYTKAAKAVQGIRPELSDSEAMELAKAAIETL
jgi:hypothetical protein